MLNSMWVHGLLSPDASRHMPWLCSTSCHFQNSGQIQGRMWGLAPCIDAKRLRGVNQKCWGLAPLQSEHGPVGERRREETGQKLWFSDPSDTQPVLQCSLWPSRCKCGAVFPHCQEAEKQWLAGQHISLDPPPIFSYFTFLFSHSHCPGMLCFKQISVKKLHLNWDLIDKKQIIWTISWWKRIAVTFVLRQERVFVERPEHQCE